MVADKMTSKQQQNYRLEAFAQKCRHCLVAGLLNFALIGIAAAGSSANYSLPWSEANNGTTNGASASYTLSGSVGPIAVPTSTSTSFAQSDALIAAVDTDMDGIPDSIDNCPLIPNID